MPNQLPTAVIAGVGPGLGAAICRTLAAAGYAVAGLARSTDFGDRLTAQVKASGAEMAFFACDLSQEAAVESAFAALEERFAPPSVLVYNAGAIITHSVTETAPEDFQRLWALNCFGAFLCARRVLPGMVDKGGTILFTGATAGVKAAGNFAAFGSSKFALRGLAQSMARELGPRGVHVAHVVIDGIIWTPQAQKMHGLTEAQCLRPEAIAKTYLHLIRQDRAAWTHELDLRPDVESF